MHRIPIKMIDPNDPPETHSRQLAEEGSKVEEQDQQRWIRS